MLSIQPEIHRLEENGSNLMSCPCQVRKWTPDYFTHKPFDAIVSIKFIDCSSMGNKVANIVLSPVIWRHMAGGIILDYPAIR